MSAFKRSSGVLLHPTSLPGPHGIGDFGPGASQFLDFLHETGQSWWQMLPLSPPGYGDSPYNALSAFAGNPLLISLDRLAQDGLLSASDLKPRVVFPPNKVKFNLVRKFKEKHLRSAFIRSRKSPSVSAAFENYRHRNKNWLDDFALFQTIKELHDGQAWTSWEKEVRHRNPKTMLLIQNRFSNEILYHQFLQFIFDRQWRNLQAKARHKRIRLLGDIPIFMAHDSVDVWAHPELFKLKENGRPKKVAAVPPDYFSSNGQLWGNPVYRWAVHKRNGYSWWIHRIQRAFEMFDGVRLDHFIGYYRAWEVEASAKTARNGTWTKGPRDDFFKKILKKFGLRPMIAEDLGVLIPPIRALREKFGFPGMFILQFSFGGSIREIKKRLNDIPKESVVYTGTHDNNTTVGWYNEKVSEAGTRSKKQIELEKKNVLSLLGGTGREINWDMIRLALSLKSDLAIVPLQDVMGMGRWARMNFPGSKYGNWEWRFEAFNLTPQIRTRLADLTKYYERYP